MPAKKKAVETGTTLGGTVDESTMKKHVAIMPAPKDDRMESIEQRLDALESKENLSKIALYNQVSAENDSRGDTILSQDAELKALREKIANAQEAMAENFDDLTNKEALRVFKALSRARIALSA